MDNPQDPSRIPFRKTLCVVGLIILVTGALDQVSKHLIEKSLMPGERISILPGFFDLTLAYNKGAAFGFLAGATDGVRQIVLGLMTCAALATVLYLLLHDYYHDLVAQAGLALILGGAFGNVFDRVRIGVVVDFLDFYYSGYHWPAFNVADSAICLGVAIIIFRRPVKRETP